MGKPKSATKKQRKAVPKRKPKKMGKPKSATKKQRNAVPKSKPKSRNGKTEICAEESEKSCFKSWLFGSETVGDSLQNNTLLKMKKKVPKRK
ncbi:uncharacterized protein [Haliotis cracherodii]|uniref:uncharacterized protein isoform X2 n=1 Tax=Haliotis cracherodii TaxID=6455 RepID=UPI0039E9BAC4